MCSFRYINQNRGGEAYKAILPPLLYDISININKLYPLLEKANRFLAELNSIDLPNISLLTHMFQRKEALLSSQIEGTQSSFTDLILFENNEKQNIAKEDVEEVSNYVKALNYALNDAKIPLSLRLLREVHQILLSGTRGDDKLPGQFRKSQNWIGGTRPGNAIFVPPPPEYMHDALDDLEKFFYRDDVPSLIKASIVHFQFETIHPFLDGNGRLGRLLISLILYHDKILEKPILYLSLYLKQNRQVYYNLLQEVRNDGDMGKWHEFFLEGICIVSRQVIDASKKINKLFEEDLAKIESIGRARFNVVKVFDYIKIIPQISTLNVSKSLSVTMPTARMALEKLCTLGILKEISGKKRDKIYKYSRYMEILEQGAEPL